MPGFHYRPTINCDAVKRVRAMLSPGVCGAEDDKDNLLSDVFDVGVLLMAARGATLRDDGSWGGAADSQGTADLREGALSVAAGWFASFHVMWDILTDKIVLPGGVSYDLFNPDPNYLCLFTNCDTAKFYGDDYMTSQREMFGEFDLRWVQDVVWSEMREHVRRTFAAVTQLAASPRRQVTLDLADMIAHDDSDDGNDDDGVGGGDDDDDGDDDGGDGGGGGGNVIAHGLGGLELSDDEDDGGDDSSDSDDDGGGSGIGTGTGGGTGTGTGTGTGGGTGGGTDGFDRSKVAIYPAGALCGCRCGRLGCPHHGHI